MSVRSITVFLIAVLAITGTASAQTENHKHAGMKTGLKLPVHRIVLQLSSADTLEQKGLIKNLQHLKEGWGDSVAIEVVVHGPGIDFVTKEKSTQSEAIQKMMDKGVRFVVCRNTMLQKNITNDQILPNIGIVPMGVGEIVMKQEQGWSYLKAGF